ncbi:hypothetical protein RF11_06567 [Thelohanellus kitauei]|uniref:Uncharacterized protein n=1 Tax=Thelohanellus kitauei TaxID=669202 RepID=A0A0C2J751_THEKT|nr:hypothetical protein RF11_06567 [Thelohanellus kitauei]
MITNSPFPVDFDNVLQFIINIPFDAPTILIESCCKFLRDYLYHHNHTKENNHATTISTVSIYKWLARVSALAKNILDYEEQDLIDRIKDIIHDIEVLIDIIST